MKDPIQFSQFLLEFYNYTLNVALVSNKSNVVPDMAAISKQIAEGIQKSFHTEGISKDGEEAKSGSSQHHYDTRPITEQYDAAEIRAAIVNGLRRTQYQVDEDDEFRPFIDLPDHVMEATGPNHQKLIVKLVRKSSNERAFLEELSKQKSPLNHIVPLLATFPSRLGTLLIVERGNSLQVFAGGKADVNTAERWSRELIEAVAFLHQQNIAHLDIKPGNIICTLRGHKLLLIDFDIAMRCKSADETIKKSCGTVGWSAPEIVIEDGKPLQAFSPIRADLWSTGKVLQLITDMCDRSAFKPLMEMLLDLDPKRRPLLHEVVDEESVSWPTTQLAQAFERYRIDVGN
ncbi:kinase-like protein [Trametopsis cervina]|nr:kinase-like protein [Trametopsis cervina]